MKIVSNGIKLLLESLADIEFKLLDASSISSHPFRALYLRYMHIDHAQNYRFGQNIYIKNKGNLSLGTRCCIGSFSRIWNYAPIHIGDDFMAAGNLSINSATHDPMTLEPKGEAIAIGSHVWCGMNVTILAGVTIGNNVVLGAGSVVTKDIPDNCIAVGTPAKPIKSLDRDRVTLWTPFKTH